MVFGYPSEETSRNRRWLKIGLFVIVVDEEKNELERVRDRKTKKVCVRVRLEMREY